MTAAALEAQGIAVEFVPTLASQEGLLAELPRPVGRALFVGGEGARRLLVDELPADFRAVYRTVELDAGASRRRRRPRRLAFGGSRLGEARLGAAHDHDRAADDGRRIRGRPHSRGGSGDAGCRRPRRLSRGVARFITFLTDFGLQDDFVGTCHGVMKRIAPEVEIIDITHGIAPQARPPGGADPGEYAALHARRSSPRGRRSGSRRRATRPCPARRTGAHLRRAGQRPADSRRREARRDRRGARAGESRVRARVGLAHVPRPRPLLSCGRAPRTRRSAQRARAADRSRCACSSRHPAARRRHDHGSIRPCCRSTGSGTSASISTARISTKPASCPAPASSCWSAPSAITPSPRARSPTQAGRHHPLRGRVPEHLDRDQRRQCRGDVRRSRRARTFEFIWTRFEQAGSRPEVCAFVDERCPTQPVALAILPAARAQAVRRDRGGVGTRCADPTHLAPYEAALAAVDPAPSRALDLGTGTGQGAFAIARRFPSARGRRSRSRRRDACGGEAQDAAGARANVCVSKRADASALPFPDASFDLVAHANMIPFFDELARVLAPGGQAVFAFSLGAGNADLRPARTGQARSLRAVDSRSLRSSLPARAPRCLPARELARKLRAQGRSRRGITGPDGLPLWGRTLR